MNPVVGVPLFLFLVALQSVLGHLLAPIPGIRPYLVVLGAVYCGLYCGQRSGALWGAFGGLGLDLVSAGSLGSSALPMALVGYLAGFGQLAAFRVNRLLPFLAGGAGAVVFALMHMLLLQLSGWDFNWIVAIYEVVLPSALVSLAMTPAVYGVFYWLRRRLRSRPEIGW